MYIVAKTYHMDEENILDTIFMIAHIKIILILGIIPNNLTKLH